LEPSEIGAGELGSQAGQTVEETGDRRAVADPGEVRDLALVAGGQHDQVRVEASRNPSPLTYRTSRASTRSFRSSVIPGTGTRPDLNWPQFRGE